MRLKILLIAFLSVIFWSCNTDNEIVQEQTLQSYLNTKIFEVGAVIACAASEENTGNVLAFFYPKTGATDFRIYQTNSVIENSSNYSLYKEVKLQSSTVFNGYLRKFTLSALVEKWVIITFVLDNEIKVSNPIRLKHFVKPTVWNNNVLIDLDAPLMPKFSWTANQFQDNAIYFQVLSNENNDLISGTYTYQNQFQFYKLENVVLNITTATPNSLTPNTPYNFTLMDVSLDNWVNFVGQKSFNTL
jgi:hypothetical protein